MTVLFVIATIIFFLGVDWLVRRKKEQPAVLESKTATSSPRAFPVRLPEGIFFAPSHTWLNLYPSGKIRVGVDDFISRLVDTPEVVLLKQAGQSVHKGDPIMQLRESGHTLTIRSPLSGEVMDVNGELTANPILLKERLFSDGWGYTIKPSRLAEIKQMLIGSETSEWMKNEFQRLRDVFAGMSTNGTLKPALLQDGGPPMGGVLRTMDDSVWQRLESEFLQTH